MPSWPRLTGLEPERERADREAIRILHPDREVRPSITAIFPGLRGLEADQEFELVQPGRGTGLGVAGSAFAAFADAWGSGSRNASAS